MNGAASEGVDEGYDFSGGERGKYAGNESVLPAEDGRANTRVVYRDYWSGGHRSYRGRVHDPRTDESVHHDDVLRGLLVEAGAEDGDEVEIVVRKTGERPFGRLIFAWVEPHEYAAVEPGSPEGRAALEPDPRRSDGGCPCCRRERDLAWERAGWGNARTPAEAEEENDH